MALVTEAREKKTGSMHETDISAADTVWQLDDREDAPAKKRDRHRKRDHADGDHGRVHAIRPAKHCGVCSECSYATRMWKALQW